jgi:hypothetical protein
MEPHNIRFGGGALETVLDPVVAVCMLIAIILILALPREKAIVPFLVSFFMIPLSQVILVGGMHFTVVRIIILVVVARMAFFKSKSSSAGRLPGGFNAIDRVVVLWIVSAFVVVTIQWMDPQATIKFAGDFIDSMGGYLAVRFLIPDREAVRRAIKAFAVVCLIQGVCMESEHFTLHNVFAFVGGGSPEIRDGHIRAQGLLGALYGGAFAGVLITVFIWLWTDGKYRIAAVAGIVGCTAMVVSSHASTSYMAYGGGILGLCFWPLRKNMRAVRWGLVGALTVTHLVMHGPVWSLIEHIDLGGGSSGYHRFMLIDTLIHHFGEWWLIGTRNNGAWGWESWDTCNEFVDVGVKGGLLTLIFYITTLKRGFAAVGNTRRVASGDKKQQWFVWCLGSSLFANVVAQFGINYMVQLQLVLFPLLACISIAAFETRHPALQCKRPLKGMQLARPVLTLSR